METPRIENRSNLFGSWWRLGLHTSLLLKRATASQWSRGASLPLCLSERTFFTEAEREAGFGQLGAQNSQQTGGEGADQIEIRQRKRTFKGRHFTQEKYL